MKRAAETSLRNAHAAALETVLQSGLASTGAVKQNAVPTPTPRWTGRPREAAMTAQFRPSVPESRMCGIRTHVTGDRRSSPSLAVV